MREFKLFVGIAVVLVFFVGLPVYGIFFRGEAPDPWALQRKPVAYSEARHTVEGCRTGVIENSRRFLLVSEILHHPTADASVLQIVGRYRPPITPSATAFFLLPHTP